VASIVHSTAPSLTRSGLARNSTISEQTTGKGQILEFIDGATLKSSKIALGTWAIGGWVWGRNYCSRSG